MDDSGRAKIVANTRTIITTKLQLIKMNKTANTDRQAVTEIRERGTL